MVPTERTTQTISATETVGVETTGTPHVTPLVGTREAYATRIAVTREAIRTSVALTHEPTETPGRPPAQPSPTPVLGMQPGCGNTNSYEPQAISCWRGIVEGQMVEVAAGREGRAGDMEQGIIRVSVHGEGADTEHIYQTPSRVGAVRIASVTNITDTLFMLETMDLPTPQVFEFDLATRRWVSP